MYMTRPNTLQRLLGFVGIALLAYGLHLQTQIKEPTPMELALQAELQFQTEIRRAAAAEGKKGTPTLTPEWEAKWREAVKRDVKAPYEYKKKRATSLIATGGALFFLMTVSPFLATRWMQYRDRKGAKAL